jgi:hypothetical protein
VVIIDPLYLSLLAAKEAAGLDAGNLYDMGPILVAAAQVCLAENCTPILCHHFRHSRGRLDKPSLEDLAFAGIREFARQWILVAPREEYDPDAGRSELWMNVGGSMGHGMNRVVTITEGKLLEDFSGRFWQVEVETEGEVRQTVREDRQTDLQAQARNDDELFLKAVEQLARDPKGDPAGWVTVEKVHVVLIARLGKCSRNRAKACVFRLKEANKIEEDPERKTPGCKAAQCVRLVNKDRNNLPFNG